MSFSISNFRAAVYNSKNLTVWKLLGDSCTMQANVPQSLSSFRIPKMLLNSSETNAKSYVEMNKDRLLALGATCYGVGLRINEKYAPLWHDLGVNLFLQGFIHLKLIKGTKYSSDVSDRFNQENDYNQRAMATLKKSITLNSTNNCSWNSLGVIAYYNGEFGFAQHCFIKSLYIKVTAEAWTNLGAFYLSLECSYLAHEAFTQAQALDPVYVECWIGQGMVADTVDHYEAFDLYRHSTLLAIHPESCLLFSFKVLKVICDPHSNEFIISKAKSMLPRVSDCLQFYCREKQMDIMALNMCGMAFEILGLNMSAIQVYDKAVRVFKKETVPRGLQDIILFNYSRLLTTLGRLEEADDYLSQMEEPDFYSQCAIAIIKLKANKFDDSYQKYTEALVWLASDDIQNSYILVALAFLQYKFNNIDQVKTLLFQSSTAIQGLLALTSLGLLEGDRTLTAAAINELEPFLDSKEQAHNVAFLMATQATLQGDYHRAKIILSSALHRYPENAALWRILTQHLLSMEKVYSRIPMKRVVAGAKAAAASATILAQAAGDNDHIAQDVIMKVLSHLKASNIMSCKSKFKPKSIEESCHYLRERCLKESQRAVLMCPHRPETWAVLVAAMGSSKKAKGIARVWSCIADPKLETWFNNTKNLNPIKLN